MNIIYYNYITFFWEEIPETQRMKQVTWDSAWRHISENSSTSNAVVLQLCIVSCLNLKHIACTPPGCDEGAYNINKNCPNVSKQSQTSLSALTVFARLFPSWIILDLQHPLLPNPLLSYWCWLVIDVGWCCLMLILMSTTVLYLDVFFFGWSFKMLYPDQCLGSLLWPKFSKLFRPSAMFGRLTIVARSLSRPFSSSTKMFVKNNRTFFLEKNLACLPGPKESDRLLNPY